MPRPVRAVGSYLSRNLSLPKGWPDALLQIAIWLCVDSLYELVRGLTEGSHTAAFANGNRYAHTSTDGNRHTNACTNGYACANTPSYWQLTDPEWRL